MASTQRTPKPSAGWAELSRSEKLEVGYCLRINHFPTIKVDPSERFGYVGVPYAEGSSARSEEESELRRCDV